MATATTYSYAQLEQLWINAGGPSAVAPIAAAIALAESSGNPQATNPNDNGGTQTSWGLWQISNGTHAQPVPNILDPNVNAQQAVAKYKAEGNSFSPDWGTYDSGAYKAYLSPGTTPDPNVPQATLTSSTTPGGDNPSTCLIGAGEGGIFGIGAASTCFFTKTNARAMVGGLVLGGGFVVMGLGLALVAVFALGRSGVAKTVVNLTPAGRIAGTATRAASAGTRTRSTSQ
jgi:lysozyme-like protein